MNPEVQTLVVQLVAIGTIYAAGVKGGVDLAVSFLAKLGWDVDTWVKVLLAELAGIAEAFIVSPQVTTVAHVPQWVVNVLAGLFIAGAAGAWHEIITWIKTNRKVKQAQLAKLTV